MTSRVTVRDASECDLSTAAVRQGLPEAWDVRVVTGGQGRLYYISHLTQSTSYADPRSFATVDDGPEAREVELHRHPDMGFGFVAGSERPVVIRFVTEGGPSEGKLLPADEIWAIDGERVHDAPKEKIVELIRSAKESVTMIVCQPKGSDSNLKSALLSAAKRTRLKNNPSRVRFAEGVFIGTPPGSPNLSNGGTPLIPNVLRVFLENGQRKSFKYDQHTTVQDVINSLQEKLGIKRIEHFALTLDHPQGPRAHKLSLLRNDEHLARIASRPGSQHMRCLFRVVFTPVDPAELCKEDPNAFEYYYTQCVTDVTHGRFAYEMRYEACLRLGALQIQQIMLDNHPGAKVTLKNVEKEYGLGAFLPVILIENVKKKEIRKHLRYYLKRDAVRQASDADQTLGHGASSMTTTMDSSFLSQNQLITAMLPPSQQIKVKYVHMLGHLPTFGGRTFYVTFKDTNTDMIMQVSPRTGLSLRNTGRNAEPTLSLFFNVISELMVSTETEVLKLFSLTLMGEQPQVLDFLVDKDDIEDLVLFVQGYYRLFTHEKLPLTLDAEIPDTPVPPYFGLHSVKSAGWNYVNQVAELTSITDESFDAGLCEHLIDLSRGPPEYPELEVVETEALLDDYSASQTTLDKLPPSRSIDSDFGETIIEKLLPLELHKENERIATQSGGHKFLRAKDSLLITRDMHRPVLSNVPKDVESPAEVTIEKAQGGKRTSFDASSASCSDSESLSTPSESPMHRPPPPSKSKPSSLAVVKEPSFGMQSPDSLPCNLLNDEDLQELILSMGLQGTQVEDLLLLFPDNFCPDKEIIDLTATTQSGIFVPIGPINPPTPFRDDQPPNFDNLMSRLEAGDQKVIEEGHTAAYKVIKKGSQLSLQKCTSAPTTSSRGTAILVAPKRISFAKPIADSSRGDDLEAFLRENVIQPPPVDTHQTIPQSSIESSLAASVSDYALYPAATTVRERSSSVGDALKYTKPTSSDHCLPNKGGTIMALTGDKPEITRVSLAGFSGLEKTEHDATPQKIVLSKWSGLEKTDFEAPEVQRLALKSYGGLENVALKGGGGKAQTSIDRKASDSEAGDASPSFGRRMMSRLKSVDVHAIGSPNSKKRFAVLQRQPAATEVPLEVRKTIKSGSLTSESIGGHAVTSNHIATNKVDPYREVEIHTNMPTLVHDEAIRTTTSGSPVLAQQSPLFTRPTVLATTRMQSELDLNMSYPPSSPKLSPRHTPYSPANYLSSNLSHFISPRFPRRRSPLSTPLSAMTVEENGFLASSDLGALSGVNGTHFQPVSLSSACESIDQLLFDLVRQLESLPPKSPSKDIGHKEKCKMDVLHDCQQFAAASKLFVRSSTGADWNLVEVNCARCLASLRRVCESGRRLFACAYSLFQAQLLGAKIREALIAFRQTALSAEEAKGQGLGDPRVKKLMRQSTSLAAALTALIHAVRDA